MKKSPREKRITRHTRVRATLSGTSDVPRMAVFRSNRHLWLQLIDDVSGRTILAASDMELKAKNKTARKELARSTGELLAKKAKDKKIEKVRFDRGGYLYHGLIREAAEGARKGGLKF